MTVATIAPGTSPLKNLALALCSLAEGASPAQKLDDLRLMLSEFNLTLRGDVEDIQLEYRRLRVRLAHADADASGPQQRVFGDGHA